MLPSRSRHCRRESDEDIPMVATVPVAAQPTANIATCASLRGHPYALRWISARASTILASWCMGRWSRRFTRSISR